MLTLSNYLSFSTASVVDKDYLLKEINSYKEVYF